MLKVFSVYSVVGVSMNDDRNVLSKGKKERERKKVVMIQMMSIRHGEQNQIAKDQENCNENEEMNE